MFRPFIFYLKKSRRFSSINIAIATWKIELFLISCENHGYPAQPKFKLIISIFHCSTSIVQLNYFSSQIEIVKLITKYIVHSSMYCSQNYLFIHCISIIWVRDTKRLLEINVYSNISLTIGCNKSPTTHFFFDKIFIFNWNNLKLK